MIFEIANQIPLWAWRTIAVLIVIGIMALLVLGIAVLVGATAEFWHQRRMDKSRRGTQTIHLNCRSVVNHEYEWLPNHSKPEMEDPQPAPDNWDEALKVLKRNGGRVE